MSLSNGLTVGGWISKTGHLNKKCWGVKLLFYKNQNIMKDNLFLTLNIKNVCMLVMNGTE